MNSNRTMQFKAWSLAAALFSLTAMALLIPGCGKKTTTATVTRQDIVVTDVLNGQVAVPVAAEANILAPYESPVRKIDVTVGQGVKQGDPLIELSSPPSEAAYAQARDSLSQARQQLAQARQQYGGQVRQAKLQLSQARQAEVKARQAGQTSGQSPSDQTPGESNLEQTAPSPAPATGSELDTAIERRKEAQQAVADAEAQLDAQLAQYEQLVSAAEQSAKGAKSGLDPSIIRTPIAGTVLEINVKTGQNVTQDQKNPVAQVADLHAVKVYASASREQAAQIELGDPASVTIQQVPNTVFRGSVQQIYTQKAGLLRGASYVVMVTFKNDEGQAKPGMDAQASIQVGKIKDVLAVPAAAVYQADSKNTVKVQMNGEWTARTVDIGLTNGEYTEIRSGLKEGDVVQVNPK